MLKTHKIPLILLIWIIAFWIFTAISPFNRYDWLMENILFFISFIVLIFTYRKFPLSNISYILITSFLTLHLIGAYYTYSEVPFGFYLDKNFNFGRNHFDRLVHFSFGLLLTYPIREILIKSITVRGFLGFFLPVSIAFSCSSFFEIIEWFFVSVVNPQLGAAYLGMQGDIWDAQKDMLLALIGSVIAMIVNFFSEKKSLNILRSNSF